MSLPDLFKKQGALASLRPTNIQQLGNKQQLEEGNKPQLLQRPLLLRIKQAYEAALEDALGSACDHVHLQSELSIMPHKHAEAVASARQQAEQSAAAMLDELQSKLQELEKQAVQADEECAETDEQLRHYLRHILQARRELDQLDVSNRRTYRELVESSSWHLLAQLALQGPQSSHVGRAYGAGGA